MTDRYRVLTVVLERDVRDDDAAPILDAIRMVRGVAEVTPHVSDVTAYLARLTVRAELREAVVRAVAAAFEIEPGPDGA